MSKKNTLTSAPQSGTERMSELAQIKRQVQGKKQGVYVAHLDSQRAAVVVIEARPHRVRAYTAVVVDRKAWAALVCKEFARLPCGVPARGAVRVAKGVAA